MQKTMKRQKTNAGRWTRAEHQKFMDALQKYGRDWVKIQKKLKTRSLLQIRSHAQKVFLNMSQKDIKAFIGSDQQSFDYTIESKQKNQEKKNFLMKSGQQKKGACLQTKIEVDKKPEFSSDLNIVEPLSQANVEKQLQNSFKISDSFIIVSQVLNQKPESIASTSDKNEESLFLRMFRENENYLLQGGNFLQLIVLSGPIIL